MNRRELLLQEMGITLWQLTKPEVLQGIGNMQIPTQIHTLLLADDPQFSQYPLLQDLLRAANSTEPQFLSITTEKLPRLETQHALLIFCAKNCHTALLNSPFAKQPHSAIVLPQDLKLTLTQKRQIWQQIQQFLLQQNEH